MPLTKDEREDYQSLDIEGLCPSNTAGWIEKACNADRPAHQMLPLQEAIDDYEMLYGNEKNRPARRSSLRSRLKVLVSTILSQIPSCGKG